MALLTPEEVADRLKCSVRTARDIIREHPACVRVRSLLRLPAWLLEGPHEGPLVEELAPICGLYMLVRDGEIVYVGQSANVPLRVDSHRSAGRTFERAHFIRFPPELLLVGEALLIELLRPTKNIVRPSANCMDQKAADAARRALRVETAIGTARLLQWLLT
jgi:hypothetical protein